MRLLRPADAPIFQRACAGDLALLTRCGGLLKAKLTFSESALQQVLEQHRALLQDRTLGTVTEADFAALCAQHGAQGLVLVAEDGWRGIALEDELENPLLMEMATQAPEPGLAALVPTLAPGIRGPVEGLLAARGDDQRAAALEQLRYATPPLAVVGELMPLLLSDGADLVRERAIALLAASGAQAQVVDVVRALQRGDDVALGRLAALTGRLARDQQDLCLTACAAAVLRGAHGQGLMAVLESLAGVLSGHRGLERLIDLLLAGHASLLPLVRALQGHDRERIDACLRRSLGMSADQDAKVLVLLAHAEGESADAVLAERGVVLLLAATPEPGDRLTLAAALRRLAPGQALGRLLAAQAEALGRSYDSAVCWLLAELARDGLIDDESAATLCEQVRRLLRDLRGPIPLALIEQQVPGLLPAPAAARARLVEPLCEVITRFHDDRTRDVVVANLARLGADAVEPLWQVLDQHSQAGVRLLAAELLPDLVPAGAGIAAGHRLLAALGRCAEASERAVYVQAAARLADRDGGDVALLAAADLACAGLGPWAIPALGTVAAARATPDARRAVISEDLLRSIEATVADSADRSEVDPATDETTWIMDERISQHTDLVPAALRALEAIAVSPVCAADLRTRIVQRLVRRWTLVANWRVVWGPGSIRALAEVLGGIAGRADCPNLLRKQVAEALMPQATQLAVLRVLLRVLLHGEGPLLATLASRATDRLLDHTAQGRYDDDEEGLLTEVLADALAVGGSDAQRIRLAQALANRRDRCSSRVRTKLRFLRGDLPGDAGELLAWA